MVLAKDEVFAKLEAIRLDGDTPTAVKNRIAVIQASTIEQIIAELHGPALVVAEAYLDTADRSTLTVDGLNAQVLMAFLSWDVLFNKTPS